MDTAECSGAGATDTIKGVVMLKRQTINAWILRCECIKITPDTYAPDVPTQIRLNPSIFTCAIHKYVGVYLAKEGITIPISKDRSDNVKKASVYSVLLTEALLEQIDKLPETEKDTVLDFKETEHALSILGDCIEQAKDTLNPNLPLKEVYRIWNSIRCAYGSKHAAPQKVILRI